MLRKELKVPAENLRRVCNPGDLNFKDTSELLPIKGFIGQDRAVEALIFGCEIDSRDHNIYATGHTGAGRRSVLREFLEEFAQKQALSGKINLKDICYVLNFEDPSKPKVLLFNKGEGREFKKLVENIPKVLTEGTGKVGKRHIGILFRNYCKMYFRYPEAVKFFKQLKDYAAEYEIVDNDLAFAVNLLVDNSSKTLPVIFESDPSFVNLFGKIDKYFSEGVCLTHHMNIRPGSLALANGGFIVLYLEDMQDPSVWRKLEKTLRTGILKIEEPYGQLELVSVSLDPEEIPINLKVIAVGDDDLYDFLVKYDPDFLANFKVKVELDDEMPLTPENCESYVRFIASCSKIPFDYSAFAKIIEHGSRLAGSQIKLSTIFDKIKDLIVESCYWAEKDGSDKVRDSHVKKAIEARRLRLNVLEEKKHESIARGMRLIDTKGEKIGQINALVVYSAGDYSFGAPSKITARTFAGKSGLISIQREVKISGQIHDTGVFDLMGYLGGKYGQNTPLAFSASLCFEQCYSAIDGDSASAAELICIISSLSEIPIAQSLAITGSINQFGQIQPVGGINEKIEGFFNVCKKRGLDKTHGVIIPHQNVEDLMLREDIVEAVRVGDFTVYAIKDIDDGLEILMEKHAIDIHSKVEGRLKKMQKAPDKS